MKLNAYYVWNPINYGCTKIKLRPYWGRWKGRQVCVLNPSKYFQPQVSTHLFCEGTTSKRICAFSFKLILVHCFPIYLRAFWRRFGPYCFLGLLCTIIIPKYFLFLQYFISSRKGLHLNRHSAASSSCVEVLKGGLNVMMLVFTTVRCLFNLHHIMERGFTTWFCRKERGEPKSCLFYQFMLKKLLPPWFLDSFHFLSKYFPWIVASNPNF